MSPRTVLPLRLEYIILGLVRRRPNHGYGLLKDWNEPDGIGLLWRVKPGPFYAALEKLEQLGYIAMTLVSGESAPLRKEYHITPSGERIFLTWMTTPVPAARDFRQDFLVKLFFRQDVDPAFVEEFIHHQVFTCQKWHASLEFQLQDYVGFNRQVLSFRIRQVRCILEWLQDLMDEKSESA